VAKRQRISVISLFSLGWIDLVSYRSCLIGIVTPAVYFSEDGFSGNGLDWTIRQ